MAGTFSFEDPASVFSVIPVISGNAQMFMPGDTNVPDDLYKIMNVIAIWSLTSL